MRDRLQGVEVWEHLGFPVEECREYTERSEMMAEFRKMLFSRIVPTVKDLGLFGEKVQKAFVDMGVISFADSNPDELAAADEHIALDIERRHGKTEGNGGPLADVDPDRAAEVAATIEAGRED
jgi:hypothetical protein